MMLNFAISQFPILCNAYKTICLSLFNITHDHYCDSSFEVVLNIYEKTKELDGKCSI